MRELLFIVGFVLVCAAVLTGWYRFSRGRSTWDVYHRSTWRPRLNTAADRVRRASQRDGEHHAGERPPEP